MEDQRFMKRFLFIITILLSTSLSALTYQETVRAYEEALENQSVRVYMMKQQREEQRNNALREAWKNNAQQAKEAKVQKAIEENKKRLGL